MPRLLLKHSKSFKKNNSSFELIFKSKLEIFIANPYDSRLKTHKTSGKLKEFYSFSIDYDTRVVFTFHNTQQAIFIDIGSHDEVY